MTKHPRYGTVAGFIVLAVLVAFAFLMSFQDAISQPSASTLKSREISQVQSQRQADDLIAALDDPAVTDVSILARVIDDVNEEFFWLSDVAYDDGVFTGVVTTEPQIVTATHIGQVRNVPLNRLFDWRFRRDGEVVGDFGAAYLNKRDQAAAK